MQLEDHTGDILRKARAMSGLSAATAAATVGISEAALAEFEATGQFPQAAGLSGLAAKAGLNPKKFTALVHGWQPAVKDLNRWRQFRMFTTVGEGLTVNCYLLWDEATRETALFDTGLDAQPVLECLAENHLQLGHLFLTHSHWDHIEALPKFRAAFPAARLHTGSNNAPAAQRNQPGENISLGGLHISHRETPGHAEDGVTYLIQGWPGGAPALAVVGDTIFAGSMGRGNLSWSLAREKIRAHILSLPGDTLLCPGHGPLTTVAEEQEHNPFF
jgi:glyoxylase-like metal-dependent hydrolase (beta-lactamase superfamily II)